MPHWVYAGIHLYLHLPAIHAYTYSNCNSHSDTYGQTNTHAQARDNTERASHPAAAPGRWLRGHDWIAVAAATWRSRLGVRELFCCRFPMRKDSALFCSAALKKDCFGATPKPVRETRALPDHGRAQDAGEKY